MCEALARLVAIAVARCANRKKEQARDRTTDTSISDGCERAMRIRNWERNDNDSRGFRKSPPALLGRPLVFLVLLLMLAAYGDAWWTPGPGVSWQVRPRVCCMLQFVGSGRHVFCCLPSLLLCMISYDVCSTWYYRRSILK